MATINEPIQLLQFVIDNLKPKEKEKKKNGEVFTPIILIDEMLDKLDENYRKQHNSSIFADKSLKWYDPAVGIGNFPIIIYMRLMVGLADSILDEEERKTHIIENMLYMSELNPNNTLACKRVFCGDKYKLNLYEGDSLKLDVTKEWGIEKFDIIIGNPPFQTDRKSTLGTNAGRGTLWDKFIFKSLDLLQTNGFLCYINPPPWRKPEHKLYPLMTRENQLLYLHIYTVKQAKELFSVSQKFDLYIIEKTPKYKITEIVDALNNKMEMDLSDWAFLPNYNFDAIQKILTRQGIDVIYSSSNYRTDKKNMSRTQTEKNIYPVVHGIIKTGLVFWYSNDNTKGHFGVSKVLLNKNENQYPVNDFEGKYGMSQLSFGLPITSEEEGDLIVKAINTKGHFGVSKVLLNKNENQYPVNDYEGKYGMSELTFGLPITSEEEGDLIVKAINTEEFREIIKATKWGMFQTDYRMFRYFRPDFYKSFL